MADSIEQLTMQAQRLLQGGQFEAAATAYGQILERRPDLPDAWFNLGFAQRCLRNFESALTSYRRAIDQQISQPEAVHVNRAAILSEHLERIDEAEAELNQALNINPDFVFAWLNLGNLHEDLGNHESARDAYSEVLKREPRNGRALARLAMLAILADRPGDAATELQSALGAPGLAVEDAAEMGFALGTALDAMGRYDHAFKAFTDANTRMNSLARPEERYDPDARERLVDRIIAAFPAPPVCEPGVSEIEPIFICGMFRSGSTLVEQILARHSRITAAGELEFVPAMVAFQLQPYPEVAALAPSDTITALRTSYVDQIRAVHPGAKKVTDKRPDNFLHLGLIMRLFPDAKIVHSVRNPLDNLLSIYFLPFAQSVDYGWRLADAAHWYCQYRRLMAHWKSLYPSSIHDFDYDGVVAEPSSHILPLLEFAGLDREEACLAMKPVDGPVRTASVWQVRQALHARSSGRWRNYAQYLDEARDALRKCGIEIPQTGRHND